MTDKLTITSDLGSDLVEAAESENKRKITNQVISQISGLMQSREMCLAIAEENTKAAKKIEKQIQALRNGEFIIERFTQRIKFSELDLNQ